MNLLDIDSLRSLSKIFTNSVFKEVVDNNYSDYFNYTVEKHIYSNDLDKQKKNLELLNLLYDELFYNYCNEYIFKNEILRQELLMKYRNTSEAVLFNEFSIGWSIADVMILNWEVQIFEIKTDLDSFVKLDKQITDYMKFADKIYIVVSDINRKKVKEIYKKTNVWILYLDKEWVLREEKKAKKNMFFEHETIFKMLRKKEYLNIIQCTKWKKIYQNLLKTPNSLMFEESLKIIKTINIKKFQKLTLQELKKRKSDLSVESYMNSVPDSLKYICYNSEFWVLEYSKIEKFLYTNYAENVLSIS